MDGNFSADQQMRTDFPVGGDVGESNSPTSGEKKTLLAGELSVCVADWLATPPRDSGTGNCIPLGVQEAVAEFVRIRIGRAGGNLRAVQQMGTDFPVGGDVGESNSPTSGQRMLLLR